MENQLSLREMNDACQVMAGSGMFGITSAKQYLALALVAQAEGKHLATVAMEYDIIQGKPALKATAMQARFQASGGKIEWLERTDERASAKFTHPGIVGSVTITWDKERAIKAKLWDKETWKKYSCQLLCARVVSEGVRACNPGCLAGFYLSDEIEHVKTERAEVLSITNEQDGAAPKPEPKEPETDPPQPKETIESFLSFEFLLEQMQTCSSLETLTKWSQESKKHTKNLPPAAYDNLNIAFKNRYNELSLIKNPVVGEIAPEANQKSADYAKLAGDGMVKTLTALVKSIDQTGEMFSNPEDVVSFLKYLFSTTSIKLITHNQAMDFYKLHSKNKDDLRHMHKNWKDGLPF